ncbi:hypothetical protein VTK73DRAFT_2336 [Phialemonium thermophilum]|uniref:Rab-GAP TBC domain-containing protein n=1 Tax=Phialemonium thermophilum TaxID=223376 RepID=A0ABR3X5S0_9PEZI
MEQDRVDSEIKQHVYHDQPDHDQPQLDGDTLDVTFSALRGPHESPSLALSPTRSSTSSTIPVSDSSERAEDHDSLVTVRLSEPASLQVDTRIAPNILPSRKSLYGNDYTPTDVMAETLGEEDEGGEEENAPAGHRRADQADQADPDGHGTDLITEEEEGEGSRALWQKNSRSLQEELGQNEDTDAAEGGEAEQVLDRLDAAPARSSSDSDVDWKQLQRSEDEEVKGGDSDNSTAVLLARLEQENTRLATNPKMVKVQGAESRGQRETSRPPSMAQLRDMVHGPQPPALRYSMLPPPPLTDLEFYAALVKDYKQTAARLPTLLTNKIRKGIPPPLRGVVWQSMCGARDPALEEAYERLSGETSPYEGIIGKDLGRSFPGVEMFRDPHGDGQRMLGRVLQCFSLYDRKIGYCQGLAFLVGPLLMHMPDKQAFCVLVRLMDHYDLRGCFLPDLSGLLVRIYQFRELLRRNLPRLSAHLEDLQVDPAYVSQWFLSFFAVTCPLPMLFRIYDVVFAEGASVTIMRVALSLMRKNQGRILACSELEDVVQLLLSRGLWDCYHYNADEFVQDFVSLSDVVTRERLAGLELQYRESAADSGSAGAYPRSTDAVRASDVTSAASRFLGRLWVSSVISSTSSATPKLASFAPGVVSSPITTTSTTTITSSTSSTNHNNYSNTNSTSTSASTLSPGFASRPLSMLRRSASKQSLASTITSMDAGPSSSLSSAASVLSSVSTDATSVTRDSSPTEDSSARGSGTAAVSAHGPIANKSAITSSAVSGSKDDTRYLHSQIEDLLTALGELQRNYALLASQLQKEREERDEDRKAVRSLLDGLRTRTEQSRAAPEVTSHGRESEQTVIQTDSTKTVDAGRPDDEHFATLLDVVERRFVAGEADSRRSSIPQTKSQLRDELARTKEQLSNEFAKSQACNRRIYDLEQEIASTKDQLRESHTHVRNLHSEKQRLERQIHGLRARASDTPPSGQEGGDWFSRAIGIAGAASSLPSGGGAVAATGGTGGGLRELKLGRSKSTPSQAMAYSNRSSSLMFRGPGGVSGAGDSGAAAAAAAASTSDQDALVLELVQAKTAEAIAKQEAEEMKQKLETLRKAYGLSATEISPPSSASQTTSTAASVAFGVFGRFTGSGTTAASTSSTSSALGVAASPAGGSAASKTATGPTTATPSAGSGGGFWGWRR